MTAEEESLTIDVGGDANAFKKYSHIFLAVGKTVFHGGHVVKGLGRNAPSGRT